MNPTVRSDRIRLLVAEDSAATREYLVHLLGEDPALVVVATARDGREALDETERLEPDLILMDVHMPRMNGYEATRTIMERFPLPIVLMSSSFALSERTMTFEALEAGALTVVAKPLGPGHPGQPESAERLVETVKLMAEVKVVRRWPKRERPVSPAPATPSRTGRRIRLVAIAASTGGPAAVARILKGLPRDLGVPILLVQHIAHGFAQGLSEWLSQETPFAAKLAEAGEIAEAGAVYVAPDGQQMGITPEGRIHLTEEPGEDGFRPSASYLFESVARACGASAMGVVLTGMGRDGASGLRTLREVGGMTLAQDGESCVVFGMPQEAVRLGAAERVLPPDGIAAAILSAAGNGP